MTLVNFTYPRNLAVRLFMALRFKWWPTNQELVAKNPETPQIDFLIVRFAFDHLWRKIIQRPTKCRPPVEPCTTYMQLNTSSPEKQEN